MTVTIHHNDCDVWNATQDAETIAIFGLDDEAPNPGDYITVTRRNGDIRTGTLTRALDENYHGIDLDGRWVGYLPRPGDTERVEYTNDIVSWAPAEKPKPAHPLADAKVGEWWALTFERDGFTEVAKVTSAMFTMSGISSACQVYVIPRVEADTFVNHKGSIMYSHAITPFDLLLGLAL